jgi:predicted nucleotide-binding protein (sugar kinase/HSP70/actin superfamily)
VLPSGGAAGRFSLRKQPLFCKKAAQKTFETQGLKALRFLMRHNIFAIALYFQANFTADTRINIKIPTRTKNEQIINNDVAILFLPCHYLLNESLWLFKENTLWLHRTPTKNRV